MASGSINKKQFAIVLSSIIALMPLAIDIYLPAMGMMAKDLSSSIPMIERSLSIFILGVAIGQLLGGALSDLKGRKIIALSGIIIYMASSLSISIITNAEFLIILRFFEAFGSGMATVTVGAMVRDNYQGQEAAKMFTTIGIITMTVPLISPALGSFIIQISDWRKIFVFISFYAAIVLFIWFKLIPRSQQQIKSNRKNIIKTIINNFINVFRQSGSLGFLFIQAFSFSAMFVFLTESSFIYMNLYGLSSHQYALAFSSNIFTMMFFNRITAYSLKRYQSKNILLAGVIIQIIVNLSMFILVFTQQLPSFMFLLPLIMISIGAQGLIQANTQACFINFYKEEAGSANAVFGATQFLIASFITTITTIFHNGTTLIMPTMMLICSLFGASLLWIFSRNSWKKK